MDIAWFAKCRALNDVPNRVIVQSFLVGWSIGEIVTSGVRKMRSSFDILRHEQQFTLRLVMLIFALILVTGNTVLSDEPARMQLHRTSSGVPYGLIRDNVAATEPSPTLFIFASTLEAMQKELVYTEVARLLAPKGWTSVIMEPPCHGEDARADEPGHLEGWRHRVEHGQPFLDAFNARATAVLDELILQKLTDPDRVAACGTSRGGFVAYHFAAAEPRVKAVAGISPVTRLTALREFSATTHREQAEQLNAANLAPRLAGKSVWLSIGNNDARVNSDDAIAFTRAVVMASAKADQPHAVIPVDLIVARSTGHSKIDQAHELLATWLQEQLTARAR